MAKGKRRTFPDNYRAVLTLILILIGLFGYGQARYNPSQQPGFTFPLNKPIGPNGNFNLDARSLKADTINGFYRLYNGTSEILTYLNLSQYRRGWFPIFANIGGSLQTNGTFIGGVTQVYWFKNGTADSNLVRWYTDSTAGMGGTLTNLTATNALGYAWTITNPTTTPNLSLSLTAAGDLSGTWPNITATQFNNQPPSFYLNYNNLTNKPTIPAQVNLIQGANISITGSYPNLTLASSAGAGCLNCNADSLQRLPVDIVDSLRNNYCLMIDTVNGKWRLGQCGTGGGGGGITQLNTDVIAGPGSGNVAATVVGIRNVGIPALSAGNLRYNGVSFNWDGTSYQPALTNRGSGYRLFDPTTNGIKSLSCTGCSLDSSTTGQIGITVTGSVSSIFSKNAPISILGTDTVQMDTTVYEKVFPVAAGDGVVINDAAISSGSTNMTSTTTVFTTADIGKIIKIDSAGSGTGLDLVDTITAVGGAHSITLSHAAGNSVIHATARYGTDWTVRIQSALNACFAAGGGKVLIHKGIHCINGPLQTSIDGLNPNSQLYVHLQPAPLYSPATPITMEIEGEGKANVLQSVPILYDQPPTNGTVICSFLLSGSGSWPSILATAGTATINFNFCDVHVKNINFQVVEDAVSVQGPFQTGLNLANFTNASVEGVQVTVDQPLIETVSPQNNCAGIIMPQTEGGSFNSAHWTLVSGFKYGYMFGEHFYAEDVQAFTCRYAFCPDQANHPSILIRPAADWCNYPLASVVSYLNTLNVHHLKISEFDIEVDTNSVFWWHQIKTIYDPTDFLHGSIWYGMVLRNVGYNNSLFTKLGGDSINCNPMDKEGASSAQNLDQVLTVGNTSTQQLLLTGNNTTNSNLTAGNISLQSYGVSNNHFGFNTYFNGSNYTYMNTGFGAQIIGLNSAFVWKMFPSGTGGTNAGGGTNPMVLNNDGSLGLGGSTGNVSYPYTGSFLQTSTTGQIGYLQYGPGNNTFYKVLDTTNTKPIVVDASGNQWWTNWATFGGGSQTWQQTLTTGSILNTTNTVTNTGQSFTWNNGGTGAFKFFGLHTDTVGTLGVLTYRSDSSVARLSLANLAAELPPINLFAVNGTTILGSSNDSIGLGGNLYQNTTIGSGSKFLTWGSNGTPFSSYNIYADTLTLNIGSGGWLTFNGAFNELAISTITSDANYSSTTDNEIILNTSITAGRTITLPTASNTGIIGRPITIINRNTTASTWSFASTVLDASGTTVSVIPNGVVMLIQSDGTNWRLLSNYNSNASSLKYNHTIFTPSTGGTVTLVNNQYNIVNPATGLATLTVNLPSSPQNNDVVYIKYTQAITTVTYGGGTIVDGIISPAAGGVVILTYDSNSSSWY